ncbi:pili assembly chaperone, partial [bacterium AH-315-K03]|nr:pili assembly chaperone [bacterium AH-315-K03]
QIRAAAFGQALMDEILGKAFDETSPVGGVPACTICTPSAAFGLDTDESRNNFDDVDDYNTYCDSASHLIDAQGNTLDIMYTAYTMKVCVVYDGNFDGIEDTNTNAKLITLQIFLPPGAGLDSGITFQAYRGNF